jgi:hypothetical protein
MNKRRCIVLIISILMVSLGCRKPYVAPVAAQASNFLVVEGVIDPGQDSTIIRLSRTVPLSSKGGASPESNATVTIESDANASYVMTNKGNGYYVLPGLNASLTGKYRLSIVTADKKTYQSDYAAAKNSPPIDSVYFLIKSDGLHINADSHDPSHNTIYYRWSFEETYEFHTPFFSEYIVTHVPKDTVVIRTASQFVHTCWRGDISTNITLGSSAKLSQDIISGNEVNFVPSTSEKLSVRYSILVKQYALTKEAYSYWQQLKKNTEQLGSIFDPQPSEIPGNIHCMSNPAEPVIGFISVGSVAKARVFISNNRLPAWVAQTPYGQCKVDTAYFSNPITKVNEVVNRIYSGFEIPISAYEQEHTPIILGYQASIPGCVDCTIRGSNIQPSFWTEQ